MGPTKPEPGIGLINPLGYATLTLTLTLTDDSEDTLGTQHLAHGEKGLLLEDLLGQLVARITYGQPITRSLSSHYTGCVRNLYCRGQVLYRPVTIHSSCIAERINRP